jgi:hypothetical protein
VKRPTGQVRGWRAAAPAPSAGIAGPLATGALALLGVGVVALVNPEEPGTYPTCPFLAITGWWCPGCGTLRAVHALAHGDLATAADRNLLAVLAVPLLAAGWARWLARTRRGEARTTAAPAWLLWSLAVVVIAYWVLRNIPAGHWLAP